MGTRFTRATFIGNTPSDKLGYQPGSLRFAQYLPSEGNTVTYIHVYDVSPDLQARIAEKTQELGKDNLEVGDRLTFKAAGERTSLKKMSKRLGKATTRLCRCR